MIGQMETGPFRHFFPSRFSTTFFFPKPHISVTSKTRPKFSQFLSCTMNEAIRFSELDKIPWSRDFEAEMFGREARLSSCIHFFPQGFFMPFAWWSRIVRLFLGLYMYYNQRKLRELKVEEEIQEQKENLLRFHESVKSSEETKDRSNPNPYHTPVTWTVSYIDSLMVYFCISYSH